MTFWAEKLCVWRTASCSTNHLTPVTLLAMHIAPLSHSDNWESSLVARALWEAAISSGHHRSGAEQRGGEPPLGENFSSLQRFH